MGARQIRSGKPVALADEDYQPLSAGSSDNESNNEVGPPFPRWVAMR